MADRDGGGDRGGAQAAEAEAVPAFAGRFFESGTRLTRIGSGALGGKGHGLLRASRVLERTPALAAPGFELEVPPLTALTADLFDLFLQRNGLRDPGGADREVAQAFQQAELPREIDEALRGVAADARLPLAVRSSSALEDTLGHPLAGVYLTKMLPGTQSAAEERHRSLAEAIKLVYASTFFAAARAYRQALGIGDRGEHMGVVVQELVGRTRGERFYPDVSGVVRSLNAYPVGPALPEQGVASLALGLGKTIVDGGACWSFSPAHPKVGPPFGSNRDRLRGTQGRFWAVNVGTPPPRDAIRETEHLVHLGLEAAAADGALASIASSYDPADDRLTPGIGRPGTPVLDFAPLLALEQLPLAAQLRALLDACEQEVSGPVEVEFAITLPTRPGVPARFGVLQVRGLAGLDEDVAVSDEELSGGAVLVSSRHAAGNGVTTGLRDVVYLDPEAFDPLATRAIAREVETANARLVGEGRRSVLIGFGRWGTADPALGIPVSWPQVSGAAALVEAALPRFRVEPSQGSHFFHNLVNMRVSYLSTGAPGEQQVDWSWLDGCEVVERQPHLRHVRCPAPLTVRVDGRQRRGAILR